jgi:hypothetical protein
MAKITTIPDKPKKGKQTSSAAPPSSLPVIVLGLLSLIVGVLIHVQAVHRAPDGDGKLLKMSSDDIRKHLKLAHSWPGTRFFDDHANGVLQYFLVLLAVFKEICIDDTGRALLLIVSTCIAPFCSFLAIEGLKDGNAAVLSITTLIAVTSLGQAICIGAAMPLVMGPMYAYMRWTEVRQGLQLNLKALGFRRTR